MHPRSESQLKWRYVKGCGFVDKAEAFAIVILPTSPHLQQQRQQYHRNHKTNRKKVYICKTIVHPARWTIKNEIVKVIALLLFAVTFLLPCILRNNNKSCHC